MQDFDGILRIFFVFLLSNFYFPKNMIFVPPPTWNPGSTTVNMFRSIHFFLAMKKSMNQSLLFVAIWITIESILVVDKNSYMWEYSNDCILNSYDFFIWEFFLPNSLCLTPLPIDMWLRMVGASCTCIWDIILINLEEEKR